MERPEMKIYEVRGATEVGDVWADGSQQNLLLWFL